MVQNQAYALPARACYAFVQGSGIEESNDGSTWQAVTLDTNKNFIAVAPFVRSTAASTTIMLKAT